MNSNLLQKTPIAIIGQAAIFAKAASLTEYWDNILNKIDGITDVPPSRWDPADYYDPDPTAEDKTYCKVGGFIPDIDFNPLEFGLPPNLLEVTDSSQLLGLVAARDAMEDAGYGTDTEFDRENTGVVLGVAGGQKLISDLSSRLQYPIWQKVLESSGISPEDTEIIIEKMKMAYAPWNENSFPGLLGNVIAGRIANRLDLGGMNSVIDAACASSLAAVKSSVSELIEGRANMMITGGVDADNSPFTYLCFSKTPAFSPSQKIRPFDQESDGMLIGEGLGMIVLKRLEDAERDGDRIYAVIRGIGSSSDGKYKSIYAPRPSGQSLAIKRAYQEAGFAPHAVGLVEAHGTGTKAGDPAEFTGLKAVFGTPNGNKQSIAIGSVKSQIGHTKAAAGAAAMIKTALALHQRVLPPTLNVEQPSETLEIEDTHFYINTETRPWFRRSNEETRKAAVSAFGFGGTNFHIVLEEYNSASQPYRRLGSVSQSVLVSGETTVSLLKKIKEIEKELGTDNARENYLALIHNSKSAIPQQDHPRLGFVSDSLEEAQKFIQDSIKLLEKQPDADAWDHPRGITFRSRGITSDEKVIALFPGQGSQYLNMASELAINFPPVMEAFELMDQLFLEQGQTPLSRMVYPPPVFSDQDREKQQLQLRETDYAQAGIGVVSYGIFKILEQAGFEPDMTAGHSFGELTALWAGGSLNDQEFLRLVKARGSAMRPPSEKDFDTGTMAAVKGPLQEIEKIIEPLEDVIIANENSPSQVVLAGPREKVNRADKVLTKAGYKVTQLPVSAAFHTPLVEHASKPFAEAVNKEKFNKSNIPVYSNTTGKPYPADTKKAQKILSDHILHPVIFKTQIEEIYKNGGRVFVEIGPRQILGSLVKDILDGQPHSVVSVNPSRDKSSDRQLREAAVVLKVLGLPLKDIDPYQTNAKRKEVQNQDQ
ncbi:MAG: acyltransferase domain-containing protein [Anaerolineales bacterium]|nr:acyltransferase domain-containing protein [Anaerolineales bacterium]